MRSLWFKAKYVDAILSGDKTETTRAGIRSIKPGTLMSASVGPIKPFVYLEVLHCEHLHLSDLAPDKILELRDIYATANTFTRIHFRVISTHP